MVFAAGFIDHKGSNLGYRRAAAEPGEDKVGKFSVRIAHEIPIARHPSVQRFHRLFLLLRFGIDEPVLGIQDDPIGHEWRKR